MTMTDAAPKMKPTRRDTISIGGNYTLPNARFNT